MAVSIGQNAPQEKRRKTHFIYLALCRDSGGLVFFKIGVTSNPRSRLANLRVGCPLPFKAMYVVGLDCRADAFKCESALHKVFRKRWLFGEWFSFRPASEVDCREISDGCTLAFDSAGVQFGGWRQLPMDSLPSRQRGAAKLLFEPHQDYSVPSLKSAFDFIMQDVPH